MGYQWKPGDEAICIYNFVHEEWRKKLWPYCPKVGEKFVVRDVFLDNFDGHVSLRFVGITCGFHPIWEAECGYGADRFRPVVKTDISILEEIARKVTQGETVDA